MAWFKESDYDRDHRFVPSFLHSCLPFPEVVREERGVAVGIRSVRRREFDMRTRACKVQSVTRVNHERRNTTTTRHFPVVRPTMSPLTCQQTPYVQNGGLEVTRGRGRYPIGYQRDHAGRIFSHG